MYNVLIGFSLGKSKIKKILSNEILFGILLLAHESLFSPLRYLSIPPNGEICISTVVAKIFEGHPFSYAIFLCAACFASADFA